MPPIPNGTGEWPSVKGLKVLLHIVESTRHQIHSTYKSLHANAPCRQNTLSSGQNLSIARHIRPPRLAPKAHSFKSLPCTRALGAGKPPTICRRIFQAVEFIYSLQLNRRCSLLRGLGLCPHSPPSIFHPPRGQPRVPKPHQAVTRVRNNSHASATGSTPPGTINSSSRQLRVGLIALGGKGICSPGTHAQP